MKTELTGAQVRMARAFLRWSVAELAAKANVGISTVQRIEAADDPAVHDDLDWRASASLGEHSGNPGHLDRSRHHSYSG